MSRTWAELLGDAEDGEREAAERAGFLSRMRDSLGKSRRALVAELGGSFDPNAEDAWERLEVALVRADVGVPATAELVSRLEARGELTDLGEALAEELEALFGEPPSLASAPEPPTVILVVGVNGTGKTTTIGKIAHDLSQHGRTVALAAADTFRAAADEQLAVWASRAGAELVKHQHGADPGAVAYDAFAFSRARGLDVLLVDTAGRLHTKTPLMDELGKVRRVIEKEGQVQEVLLVIDATAGQNGLVQAREFAQATGVTGVVLTKLDGTAKGGIALSIEENLDIPIKLIGVGEGIEDMEPFDPKTFVDALLS